jgi:hypothetical protein
MFKFNTNQKRRDEILGITCKDDYERFEDINVETLKILLDEKFADPEETQNYSPSIQEFYEFMVKYPEFRAIGYAVGRGRSDYRVSIEGLEGKGKTKQALFDFISEFRNADEFDVDEDGQRCWYD